MIALDTNVLVHAHRSDARFHTRALASVRGLAEGDVSWAIPWPCVHEFISVVTHPRIYAPPTPLEQAIDQVDAWMESPNLVLLGETAGFWDTLRRIAVQGEVAGPLIHDARVAALCIVHGVTELWTADRDFARFPSLTTRNPLV